MSWIRALVVLFPASLYGEGLRRAFLQLSGVPDRLTGWRGRAGLLGVAAVAPFLVLVVLVAAPLVGPLYARGGWSLVLGVVIAFHVVWVTVSSALVALFRFVAPGRLGVRALLLGGFGTGSVLAGFLQGFVLFLAIPIEWSAPFGGLPIVGAVSALALWLYLLHLLVLAGYRVTVVLDETLPRRRPRGVGAGGGAAGNAGPMKAAVYRKTGPAAEVLSVEDLDVPEPGPGEVRVRITRSAINPTDWKTRAGLTGRDPDEFQVPHQDGAGVVDAVGPDVTDREPGQHVWIFFAAFGNRFGTAAEYTVLPAERTEPLPDGDHDDLGACLGVPAVTAAQCLGGDPAALDGKTVLVAGGAGAVGHFAIELAKHAGARVVATVSSEEKGEQARAAGADFVVNYRESGAVERVRGFAEQVDRIVEVALGANLDLDLAVAGAGTVISVYANEPNDPVLPVRRFMTANATLRFVLLYGVLPDDLAADLAWVRDAVGAGALSPLPITRYSLDDVVAAQEAVENGAVGKVMLVP
jgi:NADPH2:quinone reductase